MCDEKNNCEKPEYLTGTPQECTAEQIRKCHGDVKLHPCVPAKGCHNSEILKDIPETCSDEQIKKCHGDTREHPCG